MRTVTTFYIDAARIASQSILTHKLRAFLTLIGIIIGVASVVVVGASINGLNTYVVAQVGTSLMRPTSASPAATAGAAGDS